MNLFATRESIKKMKLSRIKNKRLALSKEIKRLLQYVGSEKVKRAFEKIPSDCFIDVPFPEGKKQFITIKGMYVYCNFLREELKLQNKRPYFYKVERIQKNFPTTYGVIEFTKFGLLLYSIKELFRRY